MLSCIKESLKITNKNLIIATPLILFSLISTLYLIFSSTRTIIGATFTLILFFLMLSAFLAGWLYMSMKAVKDPEIDKDSLISDSFFSGVGEYFLSAMGMLFIFSIVSTFIFVLAMLLGKYFIGNPGVSSTDLINALYNVESMKKFVESLNNEQLTKINLWNLTLFSALMINEFIIMFGFPAMFFKKKNPFIAFPVSIKDIFSRKFLKNICLFIFVFSLYTLLSILTTVFNNNIILHFIMTLANFYFVSFIIILVFNYYYSNFAKIGSNIDKTV